MTIVDTSVWIDHFRRRNARLVDLLEESEVLMHPFVIGELACGNLKNRQKILQLLAQMPQAPLSEHEETLRLTETRRLWGRGMGLIDAHLIASALIAHSRLWTMDRRLSEIASELGIGRTEDA